MTVSPSAMMPAQHCWFSAPFHATCFKSQTFGNPQPVVAVVRVFIKNGRISEQQNVLRCVRVSAFDRLLSFRSAHAQTAD